MAVDDEEKELTEELAEELAEELPVSEKITIVEHMVLSSPPGHVSDQISDLRKLIGSEYLNEEKGKILAHAYNVQMGRVATRTAEGIRFVIAKEGVRWVYVFFPL